MASIRSEYHRFLTNLANRQAPEDVLRMANIIWENLNSLAAVSGVRRARSTRLAALAVAGLPQASTQPPPAVPDQQAGRYTGRLHALEVGPFRGFMRPETFDLSRDITLVYGANGTGKSSFCEAMESAMLGSISEAQAKRVDLRAYCNNARLRRHVAPRLTARMGGSDPVQVNPNEEEYRFCFIEKNRLDDFARIAARTPGDQRQLIATLFGVDQFADFVRGFNQSLDESLSLQPAKAMQLDRLRAELAQAQQVINGREERFAQLALQEQQLAQQMHEGSTFEACCQWLMGTPNQIGRLPYVQGILDAAPPVIYGVNQDWLRSHFDNVFGTYDRWATIKEQLKQRAGEVSYSQLFRAVQELAANATACPACGTDLTLVKQNPFERAREGLKQLAELAALQDQEALLKEQLAGASRSLLEGMRRAVAAVAAVCAEEFQAANMPVLPATTVEGWLKAWTDEDKRHWNKLLILVSQVEAADVQATSANEQRHGLARERERLLGFRIEIERALMNRSRANEELVQAQQRVAQFEETNRQLISEVADEARVIEYHRRIKAAYDGFLPELHAYLAGLPAQLLQGLGDMARQLFNAFNRDDPPGDLLSGLWLPLAENGKIEVEFAGEPGIRYDALIVFSEGHIKCLGLAILTAKNIDHGCPAVIFDDVVNAIDDEHRNGIWRTFFEDRHLDGKQIILTSHAEEFLHRIQQGIGAERARNTGRYNFLPHLGEHELRVDSDPSTKNYVLLAQQAIANDQKREALRQARPAIESLTDQIWSWMGRRGDGRLELKLGGPRSPWELHNKCTKLRGAMNRVAQQNPAAQPIVDALTGLLGVDGASIEWGYLNSGVHDSERDHEFDRAAVRAIVDAITAMDAGLARLRGN